MSTSVQKPLQSRVNAPLTPQPTGTVLATLLSLPGTVGAAVDLCSAPILWIGPSGRAIVTISAIWELPTNNRGHIVFQVNGTTASLAITQDNLWGSTATFTNTGSAVLGPSDGVVANSQNQFRTLGYVAASGGTLDAGSLTITPL